MIYTVASLRLSKSGGKLVKFWNTFGKYRSFFSSFSKMIQYLSRDRIKKRYQMLAQEAFLKEMRLVEARKSVLFEEFENI